jgi:hypothetical protein
MANYKVPIGIKVSLDGGTNYYFLTDHNRQPIDISYELIENSQRMANGTMRKYVIAKKQKISTSWENLPTLSSNLVDYSSSLGDNKSNAKGAAWIKAFYEAYCFYPIKIQVVYANDPIPTPSTSGLPQDTSYNDSANSTPDTKDVYMTSFDYTVNKRMRSSKTNKAYDYVNIKIEFTEI